MKTTLSTNQAAHLLLADENADWSYNGAMALCEYLEQLEEYEEEIEFDRVAIRCEFSQYGSAFEAAKEYHDECEDNEEALEYLQENTTVIEFEGGIIIQQF